MSTTLTIEPLAGSHIDDVINQAISMAKDNAAPVKFTFNGVQMHIDGPNTIDEARQQFDAKIAKSAEDYRNSPAGKAAAAEAALRLADLQGRHDALMMTLPEKFTSHLDAINWLMEYQSPADHLGVVGKSFGTVLSVLSASGYVANDCVGLPQAAYKEPDTLAKYVVGQAMDNMESGMPPHQMVHRFGADYRQMAG